MIFYREFELEVNNSVYEPREDSFLLADNLKVERGEKVLEIGTGCGLAAIVCAEQGAEVTAVDINPEAVSCAKKNAEKYNLKIDFRKGDLFEPINEKFDLIIFNSPYLPGEDKDVALVNTGAVQRFLQEYRNYLNKNGRAWIVVSSISDFEAKGKIIAAKKVAFEEIRLVELSNEH